MSRLAVLAAIAVLAAPSAARPRVPAARRVGGGRRPVAARWPGWTLLPGRPPAANPSRRRRWTTVAALAAVAAAIAPQLGIVVLIGPWVVAIVRRRGETRRRRAAHEAALPEVLELVAVAIRAGGTVPAAVVLLAERGPAATAAAFQAVLARAAAGATVVESLDAVPDSLGEAYRPLTAALVSAERDGAPLVSVVVQLAADAHDARRRAGEVRARQVPVRLLLPLVCCTLPAVLVVTIVPLVLVTGIPG